MNQIFKLIGLATLAGFVSSGAQAQVVDVFEGSDSTVGATTEAGASNQDSEPKILISANFTPTFDNNLLAAAGDRLSDFSTTSFSMSYTTPKNGSDGQINPFVLSVSGGFNLQNDFDDDRSDITPSSLVAGSKLNWNRGFQRLSPFLQYGFEQGYSGTLEGAGAADHTFALGADITIFDLKQCKQGEHPSTVRGVNNCTGASLFAFAFAPSIERIVSNLESRERTTPSIKAKISGVLVGLLDWEASAVYQYRIFDRLEGARVRQSRFISSAGVNFSRLIDPDNSHLESLTLGIRWTEGSKAGATDASSFAFLPSIGLKHRF